MGLEAHLAPGCHLQMGTWALSPRPSVHSLGGPPVPTAAPPPHHRPPCRQLGGAAGVNFHQEGGPVPSVPETEPGEGAGIGGGGGGFKVQLPQPLQGLACHGTSCKAKQAIAKSTGGCGPGCPGSMLGAQSRHLHPLFSYSSNAPSCQPFPTARTNCVPILRPGGLRPRGLRSPGAHCSHDSPKRLAHMAVGRNQRGLCLTLLCPACSNSPEGTRAQPAVTSQAWC